MAMIRTAMIDDDGSGTTGTIINNAWKQEFYDQIDAGFAGAPWVARTFDAARFNAATGLWTVTAGNVGLNAYCQAGHVVTLALNLNATTVTASTGSLNMWTNDFLGTAVRPHAGLFHYWCSAYSGVGVAEFDITYAAINFTRDIGGTPFAPTTNLWLRLTITGSL